jgi:hypothetical protein
MICECLETGVRFEPPNRAGECPCGINEPQKEVTHEPVFLAGPAVGG